MQKTRRKLTVPNVKAVRTFTITATGGGTAVWTATLTEGGVSYTVTYTEDGTPTEAEIAAGLAAAWNASSNPLISRYTASSSGNDFILTSDVAGRPVNVTLADDGTGTHTTVDTVANIGNLDWDTAVTWPGDALPGAGDDVKFAAGSDGATYGLAQSGTALDAVIFSRGFTGPVGRFEDGIGYYLEVDPDSLLIEADSSLVMVDIGAAAIDPVINMGGRSNVSGRHACYIKGSAIGTLGIRRGDVGIAAVAGDTATVTTVLVTDDGNPAGDVNFAIGAGCTLTTLNQQGGTGELHCAATNVTVGSQAKLVTEGTGAITNMTVGDGGEVNPNSNGTISNLHLEGKATVNFGKDRTARTVSAITYEENCDVTLILHEDITISSETPPTRGRVTKVYV